MASEKITAIVESVKTMTVLELKELVDTICEEFGVSAVAAAAPAAVAAPPVAAPAATEAAFPKAPLPPVKDCATPFPKSGSSIKTLTLKSKCFGIYDSISTILFQIHSLDKYILHSSDKVRLLQAL